eukprot:TRINITY_DN15481_c0_g1_i1.p1 TRINITY_DN15481_c0_g1~~TRINITY_DN15481_c0_g1_i1.p1  ORF type:complete len:157 (+),score=34.21 TRINITY_DN15481_c0_g1_i1:187-657(+)
MNALDSDEKCLFSHRLNKSAMRDIVQFVPFNQFANNPQELASKTLAEMPNQLINYMAGKKIMPIKYPPGSIPIQLPSNVPSYYQARQNAFTALFANSFPLTDIQNLLSYGYPTEDSQFFPQTLRSGFKNELLQQFCLLYTSPSPRDQRGTRMPSSA